MREADGGRRVVNGERKNGIGNNNKSEGNLIIYSDWIIFPPNFLLSLRLQLAHFAKCSKQNSKTNRGAPAPATAARLSISDPSVRMRYTDFRRRGKKDEKEK